MSADSSNARPVNIKPQKPFFRHDPLATIGATFVIFLLSQLLAGALITTYIALRNWTETEAALWLEQSVAAQFIYVLLAEIFAVWMIAWLLKRAHVLPRRIGLIAPAARDVLYALVGYGLYFISYLVVIILAGALLPTLDFDQEQQIGFDSAVTSAELAMTFVSLVVLPPIAEEIMFRGFLFTSLRAKMRLRYAVIITSLLFGIAHLQFGADAPLLWVAAIDTFILSCFLCLLRERSGSLWPSILLHAIKNGVAFFILFGGRFAA